MKTLRKSSISIGFLICISLLSLACVYQNKTYQSEDRENLNLSGTWATLDLNPSAFNGTRIQTGNIISVQGRLWNRITGIGKDGNNVAIEIDGILHPGFSDTTSTGGYFQIDYTISNSLNVFKDHRLEVKVTDSGLPGDIEYRTHYDINVRTSSFFEIHDPTDPTLLGEVYSFENGCYLRYENGTGIAFHSFDYYWYHGTILQSWGSGFTDNNGQIQDSISVPDIGIDDLSLKLNHTYNPFISESESYIFNTKLYSNITCNWNLPATIVENRNFRIRGQLVSINNPSVVISNKYIRILYNGSQIHAATTDANGRFDYTHPLGAGIGLTSLEIQVNNFLGKDISTQYFITVETAPPPATPPPVSAPPFALFLSIFIPIIVGIVVGLSIYGYYYYKKQDKESRVVNLPLEDRIRNLLILKETGRLEESLSYLFNAIYLDLVQAKFGKTRNDNETIRDFAIISVREFKLSPTSIYPFIQKVEEIIYAKPHRISDRDFYNTIELFSPIYHELTGYNFVLN